MTKLERKWWFVGTVAAVAAIVAAHLMNRAGILQPYNFAQWTLYILCLVGLQRGFSFVGWLLVLCLSPSSKALERTK
jgi:hypothetical protein